MALPDAPAARYAAVADTFGRLVAGVTDWGARAPVDGWRARDVVFHLVDWIPDVLREGAGVDLPRRDADVPDPVGDWARFDSALRAVLAQPAVMGAPFAHPMAGTMPFPAALDMLVTPDVFMHGWDLARASGQPLVLDPDYSAALLGGMEGIEEMLRSSGHYGQRVEVTADADVQDRLIAFIGRDPAWTA